MNRSAIVAMWLAHMHEHEATELQYADPPRDCADIGAWKQENYRLVCEAEDRRLAAYELACRLAGIDGKGGELYRAALDEWLASL